VVDDTQSSMRSGFRLVLALALSALLCQVGAVWAFLAWTGFVELPAVWPGLLLLGLSSLGIFASLAGFAVWFARQPQA
jgi:hypothetical protein